MSLSRLNAEYKAFKLDPVVDVPFLGPRQAPQAVQSQVEATVKAQAQDYIQQGLLSLLDDTDGIFTRAELKRVIQNIISNVGN